MNSVNPLLVAKVLFLLTVSNGSPVLLTRVVGDNFAFPIDGGLVLGDRERLFGKSKTIRGVAIAFVATAMLAPLVQVEPVYGAMIAAAAMAGDLLSSCAKRRLKIPSSDMALGLDQIPESLLPALASKYALPLTWLDIVAVVVVFFVAELIFSRVLYALKIRDRPY